MSQYLVGASVSTTASLSGWACLGNIRDLWTCVQSFKKVWLRDWTVICLRGSLHQVFACFTFWRNYDFGHTNELAPNVLLPKTLLPNNSLSYKKKKKKIHTIKQAKNLHRQLGYINQLLPWPLPRAGNHWLRWSLVMVKCSYKSGELITKRTFWIK